MSRQITPTIDGHAKQIAEAMTVVLDQIEAHEAGRVGEGSNAPIKAYTFAELSEAVDRGDSAASGASRMTRCRQGRCTV